MKFERTRKREWNKGMINRPQGETPKKMGRKLTAEAP